jgi:tetratricopeptide (TPR) repeat protein
MDLSFCDCGSGLRPARCCALDISTSPPASAALTLASLVEQACTAHQHGDVPTAESIILQVLELTPTSPKALRLLYEIRKQTHPRAAEALLRRLIAVDPNDFDLTNELTLLLINSGKLAEAETHARNAVRIAPEHAQAHHLMGLVMTGTNRPQFGEYHYRRALELAAGREPILLANFAWNQKNQGKMEAGRRLYEEALAREPRSLQTLLGWAQLEEADRNFGKAGELLAQAQQVAPQHPSVLLSSAVLHGRMRSYDQALAGLDEIARHRKDGALAPVELLEKGRLLDQLGQYDEAFAAFTEGKRLLRQLSGQEYLTDHANQLVGRLMGFFTRGRFGITPRSSRSRSAASQPIFILGFPRSGTTLIEQTLTAHPLISAGDELPFINEIAAIMPRMLNSPLGYPEALTELWMADQRSGLDNLRDYYLQRAAQFGVVDSAKPWFTDKMPLNETHLGLISLLFPESPLLHVIRHPLDVIVSVFSNILTHGFFCAYALESAARHFVLISDLVDRYRTELPLKYLPVRYEDMVDNQEMSVREVLDFVGVPFDAGCLHFEKNRRYARTASYAQVTEKLYDRSRYRYRHYLRHLEPVIPILEPLIYKLGYKID